jgi:hypothetical protein
MSLFCCLLFEVESLYLAQAGLELTTLLLSLLCAGIYRCVPPLLALK